MNTTIVVALCGFLATSTQAAAQQLDVPLRAPAAIVIDGLIEPSEWHDAAELDTGAGVRLHAKRTADALYFAVSGPDAVPRPVDLFVRLPDGGLLQFHASMSIGERDLTAHGEPTDEVPWRWHVHPGWNANRANLDASRPANLPWSARLLPRDGVEFQIRRSRLPADSFDVLLMIGNFPGTPGGIMFPADAGFSTPGRWLRMRLQD